jgi:DnaJ-class molecular chaperone
MMAYRESVCKDCKGTGKSDLFNCSGTRRLDCRACKGTGKHMEWLEPKEQKTKKQTVERRTVSTSYEKCPSCGGVGEVLCTNCFGSGTKTFSASGLYSSMTMSGPCVVCSGKGRVKCTKCHGLGTR